MKPLPLSIVARASVKFQWMHCWRLAVYSVTSGRFSNLVNFRNAFWSHGMSDFGINSPYEVKPVFSRDILPPWSHLKQSNKKAAAPRELFSQDLTLVDFPWEITSYLCEYNGHISCTFVLRRTSVSKIMLQDARDWEIKISMDCNGSRNFSWTLLLTDGNLILPFDPLILIVDCSCSMGANSVVGINRSCWSLQVCFMS